MTTWPQVILVAALSIGRTGWAQDEQGEVSGPDKASSPDEAIDQDEVSDQKEALSQDDRARAAQAFKEGQSLFASEEYIQAAAAFKTAYELLPHPSVVANLGFCYDEAGDIPQAVHFYRLYLKNPNLQDAKRNAKISKRLNKLEESVGDLHVNCFPVQCDVRVDDEIRDKGPTTMILPAGAHVIDVLTVEGRPVGHYEITVAPGKRIVLDVNLNTFSGEISSPYREPAEPGSKPKLRPPFWAATSLTIAGGIAVGVLGALTHKARDEFRQGGYIELDVKQRGENLRLGTNIAIGVTAAAATTAIVLAIIDLTRSSEQKSEEPETASKSKILNARFFGGMWSGVSIDF